MLIGWDYILNNQQYKVLNIFLFKSKMLALFNCVLLSFCCVNGSCLTV